jgi:CheY-like chemotaxis protein
MRPASWRIVLTERGRVGVDVRETERSELGPKQPLDYRWEVSRRHDPRTGIVPVIQWDYRVPLIRVICDAGERGARQTVPRWGVPARCRVVSPEQGPREMPYRVLVVDDEAVTHAALSLLISVEDALVVTEPAFDAFEALRLVRASCADIIICDTNMPGLSGIEAVPLLREACPRAVIALYSAHPTARTGLQVGADAVFDKASDDPCEMLAELVRLANAKTPQIGPLGVETT